MRITKLLAVTLFLSVTMVSGFPQGRSINGNGFDNSEINANPNEAVKETTQVVKTIEYVAVSPEREWKSADESQNTIKGSLLAFAREKDTGKVSIVENDAIRLLIGKKDFTLPLEKLSVEDRAYIAEIVESARAAGKLIEDQVSSAQTGESN